jgi:hypothetical protein
MSNYASERQKIITDAISYAQYLLNSFSGEIFFIDKGFFLTKKVEQPQVQQLTKQMSDEDVINLFSQCGRSEYKEVFSREINDFSDLERTEKELLSKHTFADNLTGLQTKILAMINNGESYGAIVKASGESATIVTRNIIELEKLGMIKGYELTPKGQQNTKGVKFEIVYQYRERTDAPPLKEGGKSRPFCTSLINLKKVFTREEINGITAKLKANDIDRDVWQYKGGWYTNPNTQVHTPSCRHTWFQIVINQ